MSTKQNKGQVVQLIGVIFLFLMIIVVALFQFTTLVTGGNIVEQTINARYEYEMDEIRRMTALQTAVDDNLRRAPDIPENRYGDTTSYELASLYFSAEEDIDIHGKTIERSQAESDLKHFFQYKMDRTWLSQDANPVDYELVIGLGREDSILVSDKGRYPDANWGSSTLPIALNDRNETAILLRTKTEHSVFEVEDL